MFVCCAGADTFACKGVAAFRVSTNGAACTNAVSGEGCDDPVAAEDKNAVDDGDGEGADGDGDSMTGKGKVKSTFANGGSCVSSGFGGEKRKQRRKNMANPQFKSPEE